MTSYQARLAEIKKLQKDIAILVGEDFLKAEEVKTGYRIKFGLQEVIMFGDYKPNNMKTPGIFSRIFHTIKPTKKNH
jgi:hypothetical protein